MLRMPRCLIKRHTTRYTTRTDNEHIRSPRRYYRQAWGSWAARTHWTAGRRRSRWDARQRRATGARGAPGEAAGYLAEWFRHRADLWDIDFRPNFWIDGFDVKLDADGVLEKVVNQAATGAKYDALAPAGHVPTNGDGQGEHGRKTLKVDGTQYLKCPMDIDNTSVDNLQVFVILKHDKFTAGSGFHDAVFRNDNGEWDRFVSYYTLGSKNYLLVSGVVKDSGSLGNTTTAGPNFAADADPTALNKFFVLSAH